ncbi:hypothetical protein JIN84_07025 [Luteolibacter yonseiensis]|uniref:Uncharacterized protein n=1 Tax=Luteolibacter yonseiensis TaxID=1144680 RepID=A0A934R558_9BACT|nr:hypothetical protein [Luteolibacter yonseiensis]MBK1815359.1 hypothetical protein [Luteolibacter yonseiensis]
MESEQSQNFNERLSQWVSNQGFWFQIRYSMSGSGSKGTVMFHLLRMGFRGLVFLLIVAACGWVYLMKRLESEKFRAGLQDKLKAGLHATEAELKGFGRAQGEFNIQQIAAEGGNETFFTRLEARNLRGKMNLLDGFSNNWDTGTVFISRLDMELRAGADDAESAQMLSKALFTRSGGVTTNAYEIAEASLSWGYSDRTRGEITGSNLKIQNSATGMKLMFTGGKFSQNWLTDLSIVNLTIACDPEGMVFEKAEFRRGEGTVDLSGTRVTGGERPTIDGVAKLRKLGLDSVLAPAMRNFLEGTISGDFKVTGSTNSPEGVGFEGRILLDGQDTLTLRDRVHLLKALSNLDIVRNYHRVDFTEGYIQLKTTNGGMSVTELSLSGGDHFSIDGGFTVKLPTPEEIQESLNKAATGGATPIFDGEDSEDVVAEPAKKDKALDFTLRKAGQAAKRAGGAKALENTSLMDRMTQTLDARQLEVQATERSSRMLRYEGSVRITLPPDIFERSPRLLQQFPVDANLGRIPMVVPLKGTLYELTLDQAEELYQQGRR